MDKGPERMAEPRVTMIPTLWRSILSYEHRNMLEDRWVEIANIIPT